MIESLQLFPPNLSAPLAIDGLIRRGRLGAAARRPPPLPTPASPITASPSSLSLHHWLRLHTYDANEERRDYRSIAPWRFAMMPRREFDGHYTGPPRLARGTARDCPFLPRRDDAMPADYRARELPSLRFS